jgi:hypothetical protein
MTNSATAANAASNQCLVIHEVAKPDLPGLETDWGRIYFSVASIALCMWVAQTSMSFLAIISSAI